MDSEPQHPVRIGVVGLGSFGTLHAQTLMGLAEAELVAVVARRQASLDAFADRVPAVPGYLDLRAAVEASGADAWIVASSTRTHIPMTRLLLEAGKPVLLEKPLAEHLDEARTLEPLLASSGTQLMLGHILLFNSEFRQLTEELDGCGPIHYIDAVRHRPVSTLEAYPGESPFHLTMTHDLYCVQVLCGGAEPIAFSAQAHRNPAGELDLVLGQLQWEEGMIASLTASFMTPAGMAADGFDRLEVFGAGWMARLRPNPRPMEFYQDRARWPMALEIRAGRDGPSGMMAEELRCFSRVVRGIQPVPMGARYQDALQLLRWLDALEEAI